MKKNENSPAKSSSKSPNKKSLILSPILKSKKQLQNTIEEAKSLSPQVNRSQCFPMNVNEFRHLMEDSKCSSADVAFMLKLRKYKKIDDLTKNIIPVEPSFYALAYEKFRQRITRKIPEGNRPLLKINIGEYHHMLKDRARGSVDNPNFRFAARLRTEPNNKLLKSMDNLLANNSSITEENKKEENKSGRKEEVFSAGKRQNTISNLPRWDSSSVPKGKNIFGTLLPPLLPQSKENVKKLENKISRPINLVRREGSVNGESVRQRIFNFNSLSSNRYPSEHYPSSLYSNNYGTKNIVAFKHLMDNDHLAMSTYWSSYLRGLKDKVMSAEEIRERERKIKDASREKAKIM